uniref:Putative secreted protein n=1 Tax=Anopheles darlingi TaxID=43151 RepID=A0A2M4D0E5_ANODA
MICFLISASFLLVSLGIEMDQCFKQQQNTMKLTAPTNSTISRAIKAASARSKSSWVVAAYAGTTFKMEYPAL